jgi:hypothetical protein
MGTAKHGWNLVSKMRLLHGPDNIEPWKRSEVQDHRKTSIRSNLHLKKIILLLLKWSVWKQ